MKNTVTVYSQDDEAAQSRESQANDATATLVDFELAAEIPFIEAK